MVCTILRVRSAIVGVVLSATLVAACGSGGKGPFDQDTGVVFDPSSDVVGAPELSWEADSRSDTSPPTDALHDTTPWRDHVPAPDVLQPPDSTAVPDLPEAPDAGPVADLGALLDIAPVQDVAPAPDTVAPVDPGPPGQFARTTVVDGVLRTWQLYVPPSAVAAMAEGPVPLLIAFHGAGDSGANFILATDLTGAAAATGTVLAGPDGYNKGWFVQTDEGWTMPDGNETSLQNDAELALRIIEETAAEYAIDTGRVYAAGHSRGAGLVGLLALLSGGMTLSSGPWASPFAACAINAGYDAAGGTISAALATPKRPVWGIHGNADGVVPFAYGQGFASALANAGWDVTFTPVSGAPHTWLWRPQYGQTNEDLWGFFLTHATD